MGRVGVQRQHSEALLALGKLTLLHGTAELEVLRQSPLGYEMAKSLLGQDPNLQKTLRKMRQDLHSDLGLHGGMELLAAVNSGLVEVSEGSLPTEITSHDELIRIYVDTLSGLIRDPATHLMFDDSTGVLIQALVDEGKIDSDALSLAHSKNVAIGGGLIRKLPALTAAPMDEILDIRKEADGSLSKYRRAVSKLTPKISSAAYAGDFDEEVNDLWLSEVEPAIDEIKETLADHALVREIIRHLGVDLKNYVFAASGPFVALGVQSVSTLDALLTTAVTAAPAALAGVQLVGGANRDRRAGQKQARNSDLFYLYDLGTRLGRL